MDLNKNNNFKKGSITSNMIIIVLIGFAIYYFLPDNLFKNSSSSFGNFKSRLGSGKDATKVHQDLKWKKDFGTKKKEKPSQSYFMYISEQNKKKANDK